VSTSSLGPGGEFGNYAIDSMLGRGGMSVVFLAQERRLGRQVAIKVLAEELAEDESFRTRFIRESQLAAGSRSPDGGRLRRLRDHVAGGPLTRGFATRVW